MIARRLPGMGACATRRSRCIRGRRGGVFHHSQGAIAGIQLAHAGLLVVHREITEGAGDEKACAEYEKTDGRHHGQSNSADRPSHRVIPVFQRRRAGRMAMVFVSALMDGRRTVFGVAEARVMVSGKCGGGECNLECFDSRSEGVFFGGFIVGRTILGHAQ